MKRENPLVHQVFKTVLTTGLLVTGQGLLADPLPRQYISSTHGLGIEMYPAVRGPQPPVWTASYPFTQVVVTPGEAVLNPGTNEAGPFLSRYEASSPAYQLDPFSALVSVNLDQSNRSVRDAVTGVLDFLGYRLMESGPNVCPFAKALLGSPLPAVHRHFEGVPVREVLHALAGPGYVTVVDHVRRKVTFDAHPDYATQAAGSRGGSPAGELALRELGRYVRATDTGPADTSESVEPAWYRAPYPMTPSTSGFGPELDYEASAWGVSVPIHTKTPLRFDGGTSGDGPVSGVRGRNGAPVVELRGPQVSAITRHRPSEPVAPVAPLKNVIVKEWRFDDGAFVRETMITTDPAATKIDPMEDASGETTE